MRLIRPVIGLVAICGLVLGLLTASAPKARLESPLYILKQAAKQGYNDAMLQLAQRYAQQLQRPEALLWAQRALDHGNSAALTQLLEWYPQNERQWYSRAAQQGNINAQLYMWQQQGKVLDAAALSSISNQQLQQISNDSRDLLAQLLLFQSYSPGNFPHWRALAYTAKASRHEFWQPFLAGDNVLLRQPNQCDFNLSFQTEKTQGVQAVLRWLHKLDPFLSSRGYRLCASQQALPSGSSCRPDQGRAFCSPVVAQNDRAVNIVVTQQGNANTRNGVVYINQQGSWKVLLHELGHALGLADEYPMAHELAQRFCSGDYKFKAKNIVLIEPRLLSASDVEQLTAGLPWQAQLTTAIAMPVAIGAGSYFRLGSREPGAVGLYTTATCQAARLQAWKPVQEVTFMEQHEVLNVPEMYLRWMAEAMAQR